MPFTPTEGKCTGFEQQSLEITPSGLRQTATIDTTIFHTGVASVRVGGTGYFYVDISGSDLYIAFWGYLNTVTGGQRFDIYLDDGNWLSLRVDAGGRWDAYVGGLNVANGIIAISINTWFNMKIHVVIANAGSITTKIDGIDDIAYSGDTQPGASTNIDYIGPYSANGGEYFYWDDVSIGTGDWPGDIRYDPVFPSADTATEEWTRSAGADTWDLINEVPPSDADYIYSELTGDQSIVGLTDWDDTGKTPLFVTTWCRALKDEAAAHQIILIDSNGVNTRYSLAKDLLTSASYIATLLTTAPDGTVWDNADVDSLQVGVESVIV